MLFGSHNGPNYPAIYLSYHNFVPNEPFPSPHLNCQSVIVDQTGVHRSPHDGRYIEKYVDIKTMHDLFERGLNISRSGPCLGFRSSIQDPHSWITYGEVNERIMQLGSAFRHIINELQIETNIVGIYARNSPEWFITQHACAAYNLTIVPLYDTLGDAAVSHILKETDLPIAVCMSHEQTSYLLKKFNSALQVIIIVKNSPELETMRSEYQGQVKLYLFTEFLKLGEGAQFMEKQSPKPDSLYMICYTSGTTGDPKGVMIEHQQIISAIKAVVETTEGKCCNLESIHLSYLPFAHIMEQINSSAVVLEGARMGFLTDTVKNLVSDVASVKPTMLTVVPRVLTQIRDNYLSRLGTNPFKVWLLNFMIKQKTKQYRRGSYYHKSLLDNILFSKLRTAFGGNTYGIITGGAPISDEMLNFTRAVFDGFVVEGYGCTETTGVTTISLIGEHRLQVTGAVSYGIDIKLCDVPDLDICVLRDNKGEICVKGERCTRGYYKNEGKTAELIDEEGWLHTGDIGRWTSYNALQVTGRVKSIFKLAQGEYISPEKLESGYGTLSIISQILVDGDSRFGYPIAIVVPNFERLIVELSSTDDCGDLTKLDHDKLCEQRLVKLHYLKKLNEVATNMNFKGFEKIKAIHLTASTFTIENGLLTPTLKTVRHKIRYAYAQIIENLYREPQIM